MSVKTEKWLYHEIRFVEIDGEWWAVAKDVAGALGYEHTPSMVRRLDPDERGSVRLAHSTQGGNPNTTIISETGIYESIFGSKRPEAKDFKRWVKQVIKQLRKQIGLEGYQVLLMTSKERQKAAMACVLEDREKQEKKAVASKVNMVTNKAMANILGLPKAVKKGDTPVEMLELRQDIHEYVTELERAKHRFGLDVSVSKNTYEKFTEDVCKGAKH